MAIKKPLPITNCHTHIFTKEHVPPYIAKTFVLWPFYKLLHVGVLTTLIKKYFELRNKQLYNPNSIRNKVQRFIRVSSESIYFRWSYRIFTAWVFINAVLVCYRWLSLIGGDTSIHDIVEKIKGLLNQYHLLINNHILQVLAVAYIVLLFPDLRRLLLKILKIPFKFLRIIPGKKISSLIERYMLLGKFALHKDQSGIYNKLGRQYPQGTKLVVLPMDMEWMDAGKVSQPYATQLNQLKTIKQKDKLNLFKPFVFVDPRRINQSTTFFNWKQGPANTVLVDQGCEINDCIINNNFSGFKIYPALGYYPFDDALLPLWKYAADNQLPIMTHTIRGTIYYRGKKKKTWMEHPVFKEPAGSRQVRPLELNEKKNIDWTVNFTHPMNYLCLLSEPLLRILVGKAASNIQQLFGYNGPEQKMDHDLSHLKICLAHFGGEEEWIKYLEKDRYYYAQQLIQNRAQGLQFLSGATITNQDWNRLHSYWAYVDWYSIITSLLLQYDHVYSDISYILSKPRILPLLNETLDIKLNPTLRKKVLYGTDFYVVRNHYSEKDLLAQMQAGLRQNDFDQIARANPKEYLSNTLVGHQGY